MKDYENVVLTHLNV